MKKKYLLVLGPVIWLIIICFFMLLSRIIDLEIAYVLWLIGMLITIELMNTRYGRPRYVYYITGIVGGGILIFAAIVIQKILVILTT